MTIDWLNFTPWTSLAGGLLLGVAASLLFIYSGRILGITGILEGVLPPKLGDTAWRFAFLLGLMLSPFVGQWLLPADGMPPPQIDASWPMLVVAGLLVGVGTRWGAGCTSGHGVCGLGRLSLRSLVAVVTFMATGMVAVTLMRGVA